MSNIEKYPKCHMRTSLGNCDPIGGFCTSVNESICKALHKVSRPTGEWTDDMKCTNCGFQDDDFGIKQVMKCNFCPSCGARIEIK